ncbi:MAG: ClbS/DfsB family four-helix bundle protein [Candidatus Rokubacteria bacterium]|nr:ClbS/DfsB family four-helix bundle protein [Candidatus Rokubacteria bacterium]
MSTKDKLLKQAEAEFQAFKAALRGLDDARLTEVWLGTWSIKDIAAHISGWQRELGPALERMARGERPIPEGTSYDDADAWNAKFAAARKDSPVSEVLGELDLSHGYFMARAATVPEERFVPGKTAYRIVELNSAHHYKDHGDQIRAWRQSKGM